jgi:hypothetical protein
MIVTLYAGVACLIATNKPYSTGKTWFILSCSGFLNLLFIGSPRHSNIKRVINGILYMTGWVLLALYVTLVLSLFLPFPDAQADRYRSASELITALIALVFAVPAFLVGVLLVRQHSLAYFAKIDEPAE